MASRSPDAQDRGRPRGLLPPHLPDPALDTEEMGVLTDFRERIGHFLWRCVRDVNLWALAGDRESLFAAGAELPRLAELEEVRGELAGIAEPLYALSMVVGLPTLVNPEVVHRACWRVSEWAEERGKVGTAAAFASAAVRAMPESVHSASISYRIGRFLRLRGHYESSERWLTWAEWLAVRAGEHATHARVVSSLGNLHLLRGAYPKAESRFREFLRLAYRHDLEEAKGEAFHSFFVLYIETGQRVQAQRNARRAFLAYRSSQPARLPGLVHDIGVFWNMHGEFQGALEVLTAVLPHLEPNVQTLAAANLVRAAGGAGRRDVFEEYWERVERQLSDRTQREMQSHVLLNLGRGAASLGEIDRARAAAQRAAELARDLGDHHVEFEVEALLASLEAERSAAVHGAETHPLEAGAFAEEIRDYLADSTAPAR